MTKTTPSAMRLRTKINSYAKKRGIMPQVVLQNYMFECFLDRLSKTRYSENFILKGGILVSSIVGLDVRSTMDMDATVKNLELSRERILDALDEIIAVPADDGIEYRIISVEPIPVRSYPVETVLAEKLETIVTRSILNTRPRDFYDVYILSKTVKFNPEILRQALSATGKYRGTNDVLQNELAQRIGMIESSADLKIQWEKYREKFSYAKDVLFEDTISAVKALLKI